MKDEVVVVTGAGRGIGAATAKLFAVRGAKVALLSRTHAEISEVAKGCGERARAYVCDVTSESTVEAVFDQIVCDLGAPTILINNAGIGLIGTIETTSLVDWERSLSTNVTGPFLCSKAFIKRYKAKAGSIINIASLAGIRNLARPGFIAYAVSKHAVVGFSELLSTEVADRGIRVNCVAPGMIDTPMLRHIFPEAAELSPKPEELAKVIVSLCDPAQMGLVKGAVLEVHCNV